jgi:hypothetical protein
MLGRLVGYAMEKGKKRAGPGWRKRDEEGASRGKN